MNSSHDNEYVRAAVQQLQEALPEAIKTLTEIMNDENVEPHIRIRAANSLRKCLVEYKKRIPLTKMEDVPDLRRLADELKKERT